MRLRWLIAGKSGFLGDIAVVLPFSPGQHAVRNVPGAVRNTEVAGVGRVEVGVLTVFLLLVEPQFFSIV